MKKPKPSVIREVRKLIDSGKSIKTIAAICELDLKVVSRLYKEYMQEQFANSPRSILAKKIYQLQKAANRAIKNYQNNSRPEYAYAISSISGELRGCIQDLQGLVDVVTLSNVFLDEVLYPNLIDTLQVFVKELGAARDEMTTILEPSNAKLANEVLVDLIRDMKGKLNELRLKGIERTEKALQIDLGERREEVLALPDSVETKRSKFKVVQKAG